MLDELLLLGVYDLEDLELERELVERVDGLLDLGVYDRLFTLYLLLSFDLTSPAFRDIFEVLFPLSSIFLPRASIFVVRGVSKLLPLLGSCLVDGESTASLEFTEGRSRLLLVVPVSKFLPPATTAPLVPPPSSILPLPVTVPLPRPLFLSPV